MKVGDLVKYDSTIGLFQRDDELGIIIEREDRFCSGGGGEYPSSEKFVIVFWSSESDTWVYAEREDHLELVR